MWNSLQIWILKPSKDIEDSWHIPSPTPFPEIQLPQNFQMNDEELGQGFWFFSSKLYLDYHRKLDRKWKGHQKPFKAFHHLITRSDCEKEERCFRERIFFKQRWNQKIEIRSPLVELVFYQCQNDSAKLGRLFDVLSYGMNIVTCIEEDEGRSNTSLPYYARDKLYILYSIHWQYSMYGDLFSVWQKQFLIVKKALHPTLWILFKWKTHFCCSNEFSIWSFLVSLSVNPNFNSYWQTFPAFSENFQKKSFCSIVTSLSRNSPRITLFTTRNQKVWKKLEFSSCNFPGNAVSDQWALNLNRKNIVT